MTTDPRGIVDFFALEAGEYLERMDAWLAGAAGAAFGGPPDAEPFVRSARALRGAATMARQPDLAGLAEALARVGGAVQQGRLSWNAGAAEALAASVEAFRRLLRAARSWSASDAAEAHARAERLQTLLGSTPAAASMAATVVPIRALAPDDGEDHVVHRAPAPAITADQRFRQAAVPLASALRRAIGEARRSPARDDAARLTLGEDLRAALRDLRDLAESYDVRPVVNFCVAREAPLSALDERALDTVEGAAAALIESAGATWARATPSGSQPAVAAPSRASTPPQPRPAVAPTPSATPGAPAPAVRPTPAAPTAAVAGEAAPRDTPARPAPATGAALVALLETGISGMAGLTESLAGAVDAPAEPADTAADVVPIESLVYRGRAALARAREVRDALRADPPPPDAALLDELFDLLDLITVD